MARHLAPRPIRHPNYRPLVAALILTVILAAMLITFAASAGAVVSDAWHPPLLTGCEIFRKDGCS